MLRYLQMPACALWDFFQSCYQVQACSAHCTTGQWIRDMRCWGKENDFIPKTSWLRRWQAQTTPQNNHLIGVWMPGSFIHQRERNNEELKSKGRIERERQWGSKVKGSSVWQNISKGMASLRRGVSISSVHSLLLFSLSVVSTLCDPMDSSMPGLPVHHQLPKLAHTHVHWVDDAIQPSHPLLSPSPAFSCCSHVFRETHLEQCR